MAATKKLSSLFPLLSLICFISFFLLLSISRKASISSSTTHPQFLRFKPIDANLTTRSDPSATGDSSCDYSDGSWIYDPNAGFDRYDSSCKEIFKGWNCILNNKSNARDIIKWRWKPRNCDLPPFDPLQFLHTYRDTNIADRGFTFLHYNLTIAYHRTNLLARYGRWSANGNGGKLEALGYKEGYRVDVDVPESTWEKAPSFHDILIFNTGHWWWAPSKFDPVKSPMLFFEKDLPVIPPIPPDLGLDKVLNHVIRFVEKTMRPDAIKLFRTQSPRHFEGGDWDQGGSCQRLQPLLPEQVEDLFSLKNNGTNVETRLVNQHIYNALRGSNVHILDITRMSEFRADAHPSTAGGKKHDDCMHWCLPGVTDTWNDLFVTHLNSLKI
ncbi:protein trichome birefringence-like 13 [Gossypium australe]|uniref:Protein trichome birefringence-like 13 n=1 Tax=Gossypium australe TaxID=47621 RepID=A0A5B6V2H4_9ROSI|nr:protein trichome birefringence-like 13 [Gossypium australe]